MKFSFDVKLLKYVKTIHASYVLFLVTTLTTLSLMQVDWHFHHFFKIIYAGPDSRANKL